jgi:hypothetical protein
MLHSTIMAGFDPAIDMSSSDADKGVDHRVKPGDDDYGGGNPLALQPNTPNRTAVVRGLGTRFEKIAPSECV